MVSTILKVEYDCLVCSPDPEQEDNNNSNTNENASTVADAQIFRT